MALTGEQQAFVNHELGGHARLLAGPGTGKSFTSVALLERLASLSPRPRCHMITFTRAATKELQDKFDANDNPLTERAPSTAHSFALRLLGASGTADLRMADDWEKRWIVEEAVCDRLKAQGYDVNIRQVRALTDEMAAGWEALDENRVLLSDRDPDLAAGFRGAWYEAQRALAFVHVSEIPYKAVQLLEDVGVDLELDVLVVDEYQDLNAAEIRLLALLSNNLQIVAIGDDDQSIYSWRQAAPAALLSFCDEYNAAGYELTVCHRSAQAILTPATEVISAMPGRDARTPLTCSDPDRPGTFVQLRFDRSAEEFAGVVELTKKRLAAGVPPSEIAILVRSSADKWRAELLPRFEAEGLKLTNVDWVKAALEESEIRRLTAIGRLLVDQEDSLAWFSLLHQTQGIGRATLTALYDETCGRQCTFAELITSERVGGFAFLGSAARTRVTTTIAEILRLLGELDGEYQGAVLDKRGWGGWLLDRGDESQISEDAKRVFGEVGQITMADTDAGLSSFVNQLQPLAKDIASSEPDAVRLMSMSQSKGLTVDTAILLGVDDETVPNPRADDEDEERRILYVAMTRATDFCAITFATRRSGATSQLGSAGGGKRRRSRFLQGLPNVPAPTHGPDYLAVL